MNQAIYQQNPHIVGKDGGITLEGRRQWLGGVFFRQVFRKDCHYWGNGGSIR